MVYETRYTDSLMHYGIKGQKWGVRRYQNHDGTRTPAGKKRYSESSSDSSSEKKSGLSAKQKKCIAVGVTAVAATMVVAGAMYVYKKNDIPMHTKHLRFGTKIDLDTLDASEKVLTKGSKLQRISSKSVEDYAEEEEFKIVTAEIAKDCIDEFEECINKIRENCSDEQKKEISNILKSLYNITK